MSYVHFDVQLVGTVTHVSLIVLFVVQPVGTVISLPLTATEQDVGDVITYTLTTPNPHNTYVTLISTLNPELRFAVQMDSENSGHPSTLNLGQWYATCCA